MSFALDNKGVREEFAEVLEQMYEEAILSREPVKAFIIRRTLRRERVFERKLVQASEQFEEWMEKENPSVSVLELGDGELMKWFLEWLQNGGWETILKIIMDLISLF